PREARPARTSEPKPANPGSPMKMKTLREHLLSRAASPEVADQLASMRSELIAIATGGVASRHERDECVLEVLRSGSLPDVFREVWRELVLPARGLWGGLVAVWVAILLANALGGMAASDSLRIAGRSQAAELAGQLAELLEQRRNLTASMLGMREGE